VWDGGGFSRSADLLVALDQAEAFLRDVLVLFLGFGPRMRPTAYGDERQPVMEARK
jgi:hypothetical protein